MKVLGRVILFVAIIVPIIVCVVTLNKVWDEDSEYNKNIDVINQSKVDNKNSGDTQIALSGDSETSGENIDYREMAGEKYVSTIGKPISKLYTDASISVSIANVYEEADENSKVVGTIEKHAVVTAQKYPTGWTRVMKDGLSGWMRTDNISFPEGNTTIGTDPAIGKTGKVKADVLNMRASANSSAKIITTVPNGATLTIKDSQDGWYKVTYASSTGWVSASYVDLNS